MDRRRQLIEAILRPSAPKPGGPILDLSQVPSDAARAGMLSGMLENYSPGMADYARGAEGMARDVATSAPEAMVKAYEDPNAATISSAAGQTALMFGKPLHALGIAGAGLLSSILDDADVFGGDAQAGKKKATEPAPQIPGYSPEQQAVFEGAWNKTQNAAFTSGVDRRAAEKAIQDGLDFMKQNADREAAQKQAEYGRKVDTAEKVRDQELARQKRFSETETGKWYDENATWLPFAASFGGGMASRAFTGPGKSTAGEVMNKYVLPMLSGTTLSYGAQNAPEIYDMSVPPAVNPEREAYRKYAFNLPEGHPDKETAAAYAEGLPEVNPVKTAAQQSLKENAPMRMLAAGLEGVSLGKLGAGAAGLPGRLVNDAADGFKNRGASGASASGATPSAASASPVPPSGSQSTAVSVAPAARRSPYASLPSDVRQGAQDAYADVFSKLKSLPNPTLTADEIKSVLDQQGFNVAVTPARIKATNDAVRQFTANTGRPPFSAGDWSHIFNSKTLGLAGAVGVGAAAMGGGSDEAMAEDDQRAQLVETLRRIRGGQ